MTLVVTHAAGFLACFTRNPDGTMKQRALIDTGEEPPTAIELADIGERLSKEYGWVNGVTVPNVRGKVAKPKIAKALPSKRKYNDSDPPTSERMRMIVEYLTKHPNSSLREIIEGLGFTLTVDRNGRWHHQINALTANGTLVITHDEYGRRRQYAIAPTNKGE